MRHPFLALLALAAVLPAQPDFALERTSPGVLGQAFTIEFAGASGGSLVLLLASSTNGPTPLSIFNLADTRVLAVGVDLPALWVAQPLGTGSGSFVYPTPNAPNLHQLLLQFQACTLPGNPFLVGGISNGVAVQLGEAGRAAPLPARLAAARTLAVVSSADPTTHEALVAGGGAGQILNPIALDSTEIFDAQRLTVRPGPRLASARALATAVTLGNGKTLVCGGVDTLGTVLASAELWDPVTRTLSPTGSMRTARALHAATPLPDGRVLVAGGTTAFSDPVAALANAQNSAEIYDPVAGTWTAVRAMGRRLLAPGLHTLPNGRALVTGGFEVIVLGLPIPIGSVAACQTYDPVGNTWSNAASMRQARAVHHTSATHLPNGQLLLTGGATSGPDLRQAMPTARAETYDHATNVWTALPDMASARVGHTAHVVGARVLVVGGTQGTLNAPTPIAGVEALDPVARTWSTLPDLTAPRGAHVAARSADGLLAVFGGQGSSGTLATVETLR